MSDELKIGDAVTFSDGVSVEEFGTVVDFHPGWQRYTVRFDSGETVGNFRAQELTAHRVTPTQLVAGIAARPLDDADRESAIAGLVDDYDHAIRQVGDLGGAELF